MSPTTRVVLLITLFLGALWCLFWQGREINTLKRELASLTGVIADLRHRLATLAQVGPALPSGTGLSVEPAAPTGTAEPPVPTEPTEPVERVDPAAGTGVPPGTGYPPRPRPAPAVTPAEQPAEEPAGSGAPDPVGGPATTPTGLAIDTWHKRQSRRSYQGGHRA